MIQVEDIHVCLPAHNEAKVVSKVINNLRSVGIRDITLVNDGSQDKTVEVAKSLGVRTLSLLNNRGAGAATQTAIDFARKKKWPLMVLMDADGQHHPEDLVKFVQAFNAERPDMIIGNRFADRLDHIPKSRVFLNKLANYSTNYFCSNTYNDTQCGFRLLGEKAINHINLKVDGFGFCSEMIILGDKLGLKIAEVPIQVTYTKYSMSKGQNLEEGLKTAFNFMYNLIFK